MEWLAANYVLLTELWLLWFLLLFIGIVVYVFRPSNKAWFEAKGRIPLDDDRDSTPQR